MRFVGLGLAFALWACDPPAPVKTSSGQRITGVALEEKFATSDEVRETSFKGDALRSAVAKMEADGVFALEGVYEAKGVVHQSTLTVIIAMDDNKQKKIVISDCAEPHVCAFAAEAEKGGALAHKPAVCRTDAACTHGDK